MEVQTLVQNHRQYFEKGETKSIAFRKMQLKRLKHALEVYESDIMDALNQDLNKDPFEAYETEIGLVNEEIDYMLKNMSRLAAPKRVLTPAAQFPSRSAIMAEPHGTVLIMSPWNYPFQLTMVPLVGAIATGNCAVVKPSNYSPATSAVMRDIIRGLFAEEYISVVEGGREANQSLLKEKFDYIFFTGSVQVGKTVMHAAAEHLTPVTLELGGKSPCIVDKTANVKLAAKRIVWGKFLNAGQTCVAPDYVLAHSSIKAPLVHYMKKYIAAFYGQNPQINPQYPKMIAEKHFDSVLGLLQGEENVFGGRSNAETQQIEPTLLPNATWQSPAMQDEIFGPVLPVIEYDSLDEVISAVNKRPKPLALYLFTTSAYAKKKILGSISFGGGCVNDVVVHLATSNMPFGGVGESGMGGYHGKASFDTFSHKKSILTKANWLDLPVRYPPYKKYGVDVLKLFM